MGQGGPDIYNIPNFICFCWCLDDSIVYIGSTEQTEINSCEQTNTEQSKLNIEDLVDEVFSNPNWRIMFTKFKEKQLHTILILIILLNTTESL